MQSASLKGWKDLSTMWGGTATTLETAEGAPSEGTSLLGGGQAANAKNKKWVDTFLFFFNLNSFFLWYDTMHDIPREESKKKKKKKTFVFVLFLK